MRRFLSARTIFLAGIFWLAILSCRTSDLIARADPTATNTVLRTVARPTFTPVPPTPVPTQLPPTLPRTSPTRGPTARPTTRRPIIPTLSPTPAPPSPTPDPYANWYYKPVNKGCVAAPNTRIEGIVLENGSPRNGVRVRVSVSEHGDPVIDDFITGIDPTDLKHKCPECQGKYRLGIAEGQRIDGNWWVFIVNDDGSPRSPGVYVKTLDAPGCNTATVDFRH